MYLPASGRRRTAVMWVALVVGMSVIWTPPAVGGFDNECFFNYETKTVEIAFEEPSPVHVFRDGDELVTASGDCGIATRFNTEQIVVTSPGPGWQQTTLILDLSYGRFAPGYTDEPGESDEIEVKLNYGDGEHSLMIIGTKKVDTFKLHTRNYSIDESVPSLNLNGDRDIDVQGVRTGYDWYLEHLTVVGNDGADTFNGYPNFSNGYVGALSLLGGNGADEFRGGNSSARIAGGPHRDFIIGSAYSDDLAGGPGDDEILAGLGDDVLSGGSGRDVVRGQGGYDRCDVEPHRDVYGPDCNVLE